MSQGRPKAMAFLFGCQSLYGGDIWLKTGVFDKEGEGG